MQNKNISIQDYPLGKNKSEIIHTPNGVNIEDITFDHIESGIMKTDDCRTSRESLMYQAQIALQSGNRNLAENFYRAAEMVEIESDRIIAIYNALRPYRSTEEELLGVVRELREKHQAERTAAFIEEAAEILKRRKKLRGDR